MKHTIRYSVFTILLLTTIIACDKDFASIDSDIINNENATNFNTDSEKFNVIAYTNKLDPVQTDNMPINLLGVHNDPNYGSYTASIVTQLSSAVIAPDFGENVELDSVVLTLPYFSRAIDVDEDGFPIYELDSVYGSSPIKLSIYENNFFLRDFDPTSEFSQSQSYFSNKATSISDNISPSDLEGTPILLDPDAAPFIDVNNFVPSSDIVELWDEDDEVTQRNAPSLRLKLDNQFWQEKILDMEGDPVLSNANNFSNYFRGLYIKAEALTPDGSLMYFNFNSSNANIVLYYTQDPFTEGEERENATFTLGFNGNRVNFYDTNFTTIIPDGDEVNGDERIYLKGGEGALGEIKLFGGEDLDNDNSSDNTFESFKKEFVNTDADGKFMSRKRIINEANLVFYVDNALVNGDEPNRLFLFDAKNNTPLVDYFLDANNGVDPENSIINHLGPLERVDDDDPQSEGVKYKFKLTQHITNLLVNDSTNVKLGLSVSTNVNLEESFNHGNILTGDDSSVLEIPLSSIISHRGTILAGNNHPDPDKRVYLEIFYSEPEND
ncbi:DUF4270 domain-containing protein [Ichthyenterobacterium sp. W332]|uniref:DUF4270 domain-containing protein n=1 Tax=Microcosmobacter mediterraneus TaxID=3075607 RepID=A0ABU2YJ89_9FLAO|nr:DUF4270 domain-containing protein [Ichthyenterobacterium sp. W332]MDT0557865.1 DUF4270 domain-containing protein [Ichthyenterobacterium sp. W332]